MEEVYKRANKSCTINLYKNYSNIHDHVKSLDMGVTPFHVANNTEHLELRGKEEKHKGYFYGDHTSSSHGCGYVMLKRVIKQKEVTDDEKIKKYYNHPFASVTVKINELTIKKIENKIHVNLSLYCKRRELNSKFFIKENYVTGFTLNTITGNITMYRIGKKTRKLRTNKFLFLKQILDEMVNYKNLNTSDFLEKLLPYVNVCNVTYSKDSDFLDIIMENFVRLKKIKTPNYYKKYLENFYPTEKYLKKNKRNLNLSILDLYGIKSEYLNKKMQGETPVNLFILMRLKLFFGDSFQKHISAINPNVLYLRTSIYPLKSMVNDKLEYQVSKKEKENIVKIINSVYTVSERPEMMINHLLSDLKDHLHMLTKCINYGLEVSKINSITYNSFLIEHSIISSKINTIRKGYWLCREYSQDVVSLIEKPISEMYFPVVLTTEEEYLDEGIYMHHCVASYVERDTSIIISLRKKGSKDRVTIEFNTSTGAVIQARYFYNTVPPNDYVEPLNELFLTVKQVYYDYGLKPTKFDRILINDPPKETKNEKNEFVVEQYEHFFEF